MFLKKFSLLAIAACTLSACSSAPSWDKAGVTMDERDNTVAKCRYEIGIHKIAEKERDSLLQDCMRAEGYRLR